MSAVVPSAAVPSTALPGAAQVPTTAVPSTAVPTAGPVPGGGVVGGDELIDGIIARFRAAFRELRCVGSERMLRQGLSMSHLHAMSLLERHGDVPMSGLADTLGISLSNATGLVDRMEERGLVERHRVPDDRRIVMVGITEQGRETLAEVDILRDEVLRSILSSLDRPKLERLAAAIDDIGQAVQAALLGPTGSDWHDHAHRHGHAHGGDRRPDSPAA